MSLSTVPKNYSLTGEICYLQGTDQNRIYDMSIHMKYEYKYEKFTLHDSNNVITFDIDIDKNNNIIQISDGTFGKLYKGVLQNDSIIIPIIIKQIKIKCDDSWILCNELLAMYNYNNKHTVKYFGYSQHKIDNNYDHELEYFIFIEYLDGMDLFDYIEKNIKYSTRSNEEILEEKMNITNQLIVGLDDLHKNGIYHRDIKPENIFITKDENNKLLVKYIDFGFSCTKNEYKLVTRPDGTNEYISPEIASSIIENFPADYKHFGSDDLWALGVTVYYIYYGKLIYDIIIDHHSESGDLKYYDKLHHFENNNIDYLLSIAPCFKTQIGVPDDAKIIIKNLLKINPDERILFEKKFTRETNSSCCIMM
jgi:serine/threonine protein kinase